MVAGKVPAKHHTALRSSDGRLYYEECLTRAGFDGPYTILYHERRPHEQRVAALTHGFELPQRGAALPLRRRHFRSSELPKQSSPPVDCRVPLLFNEDLVLSVMRPYPADPVYFSNGDADELYFVFRGAGMLKTLLGDLHFEQNDYVFVPRGLIHRFIIDPLVEQYWLNIECLGDLQLVAKWRNAVGQLKMDAPYSHRDFRRPKFHGPEDEGIRNLLVKRQGRFHGFVYEHSPLDVVGWDGTVYPFVFPILNFQARVGAVHLPPTWHGTFETRGALICSFVPRLLDFHPNAIPCPYPHSSVDVDEVIFYCRGNFSSRRGVEPGSVSHHPAGVPHGPHPGAYEGSIGQKSTDELAVMLDCYRPLSATPDAESIEDALYHESFIGQG
jgi:homogentisate 1,2-dioxygenase